MTSLSQLALIDLPQLFTYREAINLGLPPRHSPFVRVMRGVYTPFAGADLQLRARAAVAELPHDASICAATALKLWGVDLPERLSTNDDIHVLRGASTSYVGRPGIRVCRGKLQLETQLINGIRVVHPAEAWLQLANDVSHDELIHIADAIMRRQRPLVSMSELTETVYRSHRRRGIRKARYSLEFCCPGTDSWPETTTRLLLIRAGLSPVEVNYAVLDENGKVVCYLDLAYPEAMTAVEYDGTIHVGDRSIMERDRRRRRWLEDHGWRIITVTAGDLLFDRSGVVDSVRQALAHKHR